MKRCSCCKDSLPAASFSKSSRESDGLKRECKSCAARIWQAYYAKNRERLIARAIAYMRLHPEATARNATVTRSRHKDRYNAQQALAYRKSRPEILERNRQRYAEDAAIREDRKARAAKRRVELPNYQPSYMKQYRETNRDYLNGLSAEYRARKSGAVGACSHREWQDVLQYHNYRCAYCLRSSAECGTLSRDHMLPLCRGGNNDSDNLAPACKSCNSKKRHMTPLEFIGRRGRPSAKPHYPGA